MTCPICAAPHTEAPVDLGRVPAHQNRILRTAADARATPTGALCLARCTACGHAYNAAFDATLLAYDAAYDNRQDLSPTFGAWLDALLDELAGTAPAHIVEIGCGQGTFLRRLCARTGATGAGYDPACRSPGQDGAVALHAAPYLHDPAAQSPDLVVCRHVIEHVADPVELLRDVARALREAPGATVYFECPDLAWILEHRVHWDLFYEHVHYFTRRSLRAAFARAGLRVVAHRSLLDGQYQGLTAVADPASPSRLPDAPSHAAQAEAFFGARTAWIARWQRALDRLGADGPVVGWGAGAKGMTLAHLVDPSGERLAGLVDVNPAKQGAFVPLTGHPVMAPDELARRGVRHAIVLNPAYLDEIRAQARQIAPALTVHAPEMP